MRMSGKKPEGGKQIEADRQKREFTMHNVESDIEINVEPSENYEILSPLSVEEIFPPKRFIIIVPTIKAKKALTVEIISADECQKLSDTRHADFILYEERLNYLMDIFGAMTNHDWAKIISFKLKNSEIQSG